MSLFEDAMDAVRDGRPVDWRRLALLQDMSTVLDGARYATEAINRDKEADAQLERILAGLA